MATGFDSDYYNEELNARPESDFSDEKPEVEAKDFATDSKSNMWDSIKNEPKVEPEPVHENDDDMDIPPSLRDRFKNRKKK